MDPILPGGAFPDHYQSWAYRHSRLMTSIAAGQNPIPDPLAAVPPPGATTRKDPPPPAAPEGPGGAYSAQREQNLAHLMSQESIAIAAGGG
jgi:hypothetical protein